MFLDIWSEDPINQVHDIFGAIVNLKGITFFF